MIQKEFERIAVEEFQKLPDKFRRLVRNVAFLVEDEPSPELRAHEGLLTHETLLGLYHGIPRTERGDAYGIGPTMPDTVTLFRKPIEAEAGGDPARIRRVINETLAHEIAHYFGLSEDEVARRETRRARGTELLWADEEGW